MIANLKDFAALMHKLLRSDRDCIIGVGGFTGEGKTRFACALAEKYGEISGMDWSYDHLTWSRKELMTWIDGEPKTKKGQLPEYSVVVPDELFTMFYRRKWFEEEQIDAIATFNMCRDRHLLVIGNIPDFWQLDKGFTSRVRFYVYIPYRGVAWIFEQENNPFSSDPWNPTENKKVFRKYKSPHKCPNFVCQINYVDWAAKDKKAYYKVRNTKRLKAIGENKSDKQERYTSLKYTRDKFMRLCLNNIKDFTQKEAADIANMSVAQVSRIYNNTEGGIT